MISHNFSLVILSTMIAVFGAFTASVLMSNIAALSPGERRVRIAMASVSLGGSIWAMHFVGLLSLGAPLNFAYNPALLAFSAATAFLGTAIAFFLLGLRSASDRLRFPVAAAVFGLTIVATNYSGVAAIAGRGLQFSWFLALIGVAVSIQVAVITLWFVFRRNGVVLTLIGALGVGLSLSATHHLAIAATQGLEQTLLAIPRYNNAISGPYLAWSATIMIYLICSICLCIFVVTQFRDEAE